MQDANSLAPGLMIIHGNRLETLRELAKSVSAVFVPMPFSAAAAGG